MVRQLWLKGKGWESGSSKGRKAFHMEIETQTLGKQMFAHRCRDNGTQRRLWSPIPASWPSPTTKPSPIFCVDISGDSALPGPGPVSKWYQLCGFYFSHEVFSLSLTWFTFNDSLLESLHWTRWFTKNMCSVGFWYPKLFFLKNYALLLLEYSAHYTLIVFL